MKSKLPEGVTEILATHKEKVFCNPLFGNLLKRFNPIIARITDSQHIGSFTGSLAAIDTMVRDFAPTAKVSDFAVLWDNSYLAQWEAFLFPLIGAAEGYNGDSAAGWKSQNKSIIDKDRGKLRQIADTAYKLELLLRDVDNIGHQSGFEVKGLNDPLELLVCAADRLKDNPNTKPIGERFSHRYEPLTRYPKEQELPSRLLIREIRLRAESGEIRYTRDSKPLLAPKGRYSNFINAFAGELRRKIDLGHLPPEIFNLPDKQWLSIFSAVLDNDGMIEKNISTTLKNYR